MLGRLDDCGVKLNADALSGNGAHTSDSMWANMLESDPVGATWGTGVRRAPPTATWGWNVETRILNNEMAMKSLGWRLLLAYDNGALLGAARPTSTDYQAKVVKAE